jgi:amino acid adenylation domain-containing protein
MMPDPKDYSYSIGLWNNTYSDYPKGKTIVQLFEEQADKAPEKIALISEETNLTYRELNERSNQLAHHIRQRYSDIYGRNLSCSDIVAVCTPRSIEMLVGILATMKAGAAYVPLDAEYPPGRTEFILRDTDARLILTQSHLVEKINGILSTSPRKDAEAGDAAKTGMVVDLNDERCFKYWPESSISIAGPMDNAYVIYTSGSTGRPKGVCMAHEALVFMIWEYIRNIEASPDDVFDFAMSIAFTGSIPCIYPPLLLGATLVIESFDIYSNPQSYARKVKERGISVLKLTPSLFNLVAESLIAENIDDIKVVLSGEALQEREFLPFMKKKGWRIYNQYGFTECVSGFSITELHKDALRADGGQHASIGTPYRGRRILPPQELDENGGFELMVGGKGLASGYLNREEDNRKKFITVAGENYYATGDIVRIADGALELIGRRDQQIKVKGIRVEVSEIANLALSCEGIAQVHVKGVSNASGDRFDNLALYYTKEKKDLKNNSNLYEYLSRYLPPGIVPAFIIELDEMPLNQHGKVDADLLPDPMSFAASREIGTTRAEYSELESAICHIWEKVLGHDRFDRYSNFFQVGGNSLKGYQVLSSFNKRYNADYGIRFFFENNTIHSFAQKVQQLSEQKASLRLVYEEF